MRRRVSDFEKKHTLQERKKVCESLVKKCPERIPVILIRGTSEVPQVERTKYLVPADMTIGKFMYEIRKNMPVEMTDKALFLFVGDNVIPPNSSSLQWVHNKYRAEDGFLYIVYSGENTFG